MSHAYRRARFAAVFLALLVAAAWSDEVELVTGEKLRGTVVERTDTQVVLDHPVLGRLVIPVAQLAPEAPPTAEAPAAPLPEPPPPSPWKFKVELGAAGERGSVDQSDLHAAVGAVLDDADRRLALAGGHDSSKTEGVRTKNSYFAEGTHDWKFADSPWSLFATARGDWDDFQDWDHRVSVGVGPGYLLVDREDLEIRLRAGVNETRQWGASNDDYNAWRTELLLGGEMNWKVNESNTVEARVTWYPDLSNSGEYRVVGSAAWSIKLAKDGGLSLKLGVEDEYDTHVEDPYEKNDFKYFVALLYEF